MKNVALLTGGGDSAGINAALWSAVRSCVERGWKPIGVRRGWSGILQNDFAPHFEVSYEAVDRPGTVLQTSRTNPIKEGPEGLDHLVSQLEMQQIHGLIVIGGDDTLSVAAALSQKGYPVVGIPQTIDNDIPGTDYCLGFATACQQIYQAIMGMRPSNISHQRGMIVEVMGRDSGWLALEAARATGALGLLIPECFCSVAAFASAVMQRLAVNDDAPLIIVAEGISSTHFSLKHDAIDAFGNSRLEGAGQAMARYFNKNFGQDFRCQVLGFLQRGGTLNYQDVLVGKLFGREAVRCLENGQNGCLVGLQAGATIITDLQEITGKRRKVPRDVMLQEESLLGLS